MPSSLTALVVARLLVVPFDPDEVWGVKAVHHVNGTVNGTPGPGDARARQRRMGVHPEPVADAGSGSRSATR